MVERRALAVVYYEPHKRDLLRDCVLPVARRLQRDGGLQAVYLMRHWRHGPQVQIRLTNGADGWPEDLLRDAAAEIGAYLERRPSTTELSEDDYLTMARALGEAELVLPPYLPLWPNNSVRQVPVTDDGDMLGSPAAVEAKERLLHASLGWLEAALPFAAPASTRVDLCWRLLAVVAAGYPRGGLVSGQMSLRSHVEEHLVHADPGGKLRAAFQRRLDRAVPALLPGFRSLASECETGRYLGGDEVLRRWQQVLDVGWPSAERLVRAGDFVAYGDTGTAHLRRAAQLGAHVLRRWRGGDDRPYSEFHRLLRQLKGRPEGVDVVEFGAFRFLLNHAYSLLALLDVSPTERYFACLLVSTLTESAFGVSSLDLIREELA